MRRLLSVVAGAACLLAPAAFADDQAQLFRGHAYAMQMCGDCHAIERAETRSPAKNAPTFSEVAATPGMTGTAIAAWMQSDHPSMPGIVLKTETLEAIIAYILSLKAPAAG